MLTDYTLQFIIMVFILCAFNTIVFKELFLKTRLLLVAFGVDDAVGECITEILVSELDTLVFKSSKVQNYW